MPHQDVLSHLFFAGAGEPHHLWQLATRPGWGTPLGLCHAAAASLEAFVGVDSGVLPELLPEKLSIEPCNPATLLLFHLFPGGNCLPQPFCLGPHVIF